jgi:hypothetical protein
VLLAFAVALLALAPGASALVHRGHEFGVSFGSGQLTSPGGIAVNESTGDVYVLDSGKNRIVHYGPNHEFLAAWGAGVKSAGGKTYEVCTVEAECKAGTAGVAKGEFQAPPAIAVDNAAKSPSNGDVYVVANRTAKKAVIDKFSPSGELIARLLASKEEHEEHEAEPIVGVAVDPTGTVWVDREPEEAAGEEVLIFQRLDNQTQNHSLGPAIELEETGVEGAARPGLAVDGKGGLYFTLELNGHTLLEQQEEEEEIKEREKERKEEHEPPANEKPQLPCEKHPCLGLKIALTPAGEKGEVANTAKPLSGLTSTGITVDQSSGAQSSGDAYLDILNSITAFTASGTPIQSFGSEQLAGSSGGGVTVNAARNEVLVADSTAGVIDTFVPAKPGPPVIAASSPKAAHLTSSSGELRATIDPNGAESHYRFQFGTESCAESVCQETPAAGSPAAALGSGFGDTPASQSVTGLAPSTTYHVRVSVEYSFEEGGEKKTGTVVSEEHTFTTQSSAVEAALPDGRAWEQVSPPLKHGASIELTSRETPGVAQAAANGKALTYMTTAPLGENEPEGYRGPEYSQTYSHRSAGGWSTKDLAAGNLEATGIRIGEVRQYDFFSTQLESALVQLADAYPLSEQATERTVYRANGLPCGPQPVAENCFEPLVTAENDTAHKALGNSATNMEIVGSTPDLSHVVILSKVALTPETPSTALYEWTGGQLTPISILPSGKTTGTVYLGGAKNPSNYAGEGRMVATAISSDGSRVEWNASDDLNPHLYQRNVPAQETLRVDELQTGVTEPPAEVEERLRADFQTASADGSKVFFTDSARLTKNSKAPNIQKAGELYTPDLYVFEPEKPAGERVTDLTVPTGKEFAGVQGALVGASEDGSTVYFVANSVLAPGAQRGSCGEAGGTGCNLYVVHDGPEGWEAPTFIGHVSNEDNPDWGKPTGVEETHLSYKTSEVSQNGEYLAFMSNESLTGYDNTDANSAVRDEEVFLYDRQSGHLICASCNPSGAQPVGVFDSGQESSEGFGLLVDRNRIFGGDLNESTDRWLAGSLPGWSPYSAYATVHQPQYLTNQGRLFFNSSDALVARDTNGKEDVYQYEPVGMGSCATANTQEGCVALISSGQSDRESAFLDASESGNDVFFVTTAKLASSDVDTGLDIYDARVCEAAGSEPCPTAVTPPPPPCSGEACKRAAEGAQSYESAATQNVGPSGNVKVLGTTTTTPPTSKPPTSKPPAKPLTKAQLLAKALKACHKIKSKSKRVACEKTAHKRYGARKASKAKHSVRKGVRR